jgi:hypothetical protein
LKYKLFLKDSSLWLLIISNLYILLQYARDRHSADSVALLYWMQGLLIGAFNTLGILFFKNSNPQKKSLGKKAFQSIFFWLHYFFFHIIIFIFLLDKAVDVRFINYKYLKVSMLFLFLSLLIDFTRTLIAFRDRGVNINLLFFLPYIRIIPLTAIIFLVSFVPSTSLLIFLILKSIGDIVAYILFQNLIRSKLNRSAL